jgi:hypothetical protein
LTGKTFLDNLNARAKKDFLQSEECENESVNLFQLRHKIRELTKLKQSVDVAKENSELIKRL